MDLRKRHVPKILSDAAAEINAAEENIADFVRILTWEQIEHWQKDNEYIRSGYRRYVICVNVNIRNVIDC